MRKFLLTTIILTATLSISAQSLSDTTISIFVQGGYFKSYDENVKGYNTINIGYLKSKTFNKETGFDFLANFGNDRNDNAWWANGLTQDSIIYFESYSSFTELELRYSYKKRYYNKGNFSAGVIGSIGGNYFNESLVSDAVPNSDQTTFSLWLRLMPFLEYKISEKMALLADTNILKILAGYQLDDRFDHGFVTAISRLAFTNFHIGVLIKMN